MLVGKEFVEYFDGKVRQVFVYLTSRCQLRCRQCLYKPLLSNESDDLDFDTLICLLGKFREYGAFKLSFLGGEPTIYKDSISGATFSDIVNISKELGYSYIRVDTNGQFSPALLLDSNVQKLDEITFSLDGYDEETHDAMRGKGVFSKCISNIKSAVQLGYKVQITTCFHNVLCSDVDTGIESILRIISLCDEIGVQSLNLHPILKVGAERDKWIGDTEINPHLWLKIYYRMLDVLQKAHHKVNVRLPMRYVEESLQSKSHDYCPLKMGERALVMPDNTIKVCAFNIGAPYCVARFSKTSILYEKKYNELSELDDSSICCNQTSPDDLSALCMSYKPNQNEIVWSSIFTKKESAG